MIPKSGFLSRITALLLMSAVWLQLDAAAAPTALARFKDWTVYTDQNGGELICYAATSATDKAPRTADHGDVWFYVTSSRSGARRSQPSLRVGYELRADVPGQASVGRSKWPLFGAGPEAFAMDEDDPNLVRAIKRGRELRVEAVSSRNTSVAYHFSLAGSADAVERAETACR